VPRIGPARRSGRATETKLPYVAAAPYRARPSEPRRYGSEQRWAQAFDAPAVGHGRPEATADGVAGVASAPTLRRAKRDAL
jgi:hypothetical protein